MVEIIWFIRDVDFGLILKCVSNSEQWQSKGKKRLKAAAAAFGFWSVILGIWWAKTWDLLLVVRRFTPFCPLGPLLFADCAIYEYSDERLRNIQPYFLYLPPPLLWLVPVITGLPFGIYNFNVDNTCFIYNMHHISIVINMSRDERFGLYSHEEYWIYWNVIIIGTVIAAFVIIARMVARISTRKKTLVTVRLGAKCNLRQMLYLFPLFAKSWDAHVLKSVRYHHLEWIDLKVTTALIG
jgi:hypothetical protein